MTPQHIDDLPRRDDDNRQLMLGLIDDLPQERTANDARCVYTGRWFCLDIV